MTTTWYGRPVLLDLFCGAGGAAMGYHQAGFDVIGVDIKPQPRYPFRFVQGDALDVLAGWDLMPPFAAVHASPPCQAFSRLGSKRDSHPDLVDVIRRCLRATGKPYVIENIPNAPLEEPVVLCGPSFGLDIVRHRLFESNVMFLIPPCSHVRGGIRKGLYVSFRRGQHPDGWRPGRRSTPSDFRDALGAPWMNTEEAAQAIPPAFTRLLGEQLLDHLAVTAA